MPKFNQQVHQKAYFSTQYPYFIADGVQETSNEFFLSTTYCDTFSGLKGFFVIVLLCDNANFRTVLFRNKRRVRLCHLYYSTYYIIDVTSN